GRTAGERLRRVGAALVVSFPPFDLRGLTLGLVRTFQLMVPRGLAEQLLDVRGCVVCRRRIDADDPVLAIELITRPKLETRDAVRIDADEVQPIGRDLQGELLYGFAVTAVEQRRL